MSGIFGIYHPDDRPINPVHLQKMADSIAHRGPNGTKIIQQDHIGFGHCMLRTTPESLKEQLPFRNPESQQFITADARIDNREELAAGLALQNSSHIPDSLLILYAYQKWGTESFSRLLGDFSFVIWDPQRRQLICVRDYIGIKPFYYHHSSKRFLFSSEIKQLAEHPDVPLAVNEGMVGEYLSFSFCSKTETLFTHINRLAPGHYLIIGPDSLTSRCYWSGEPGRTLYYKKSSEYTEHFLEIFQRAVACRLRCNGEISAELSGGLDSSTVVGMACHLLRQQNNFPLQTYSLTYPNKPFDEKEYIDAVLKHNTVPAHLITCREAIIPAWKEQVRQTFEPPDFPNLSINDLLLSAVRENKSPVILSGIGGDECFTGSGYPYLDYLQSGKVIPLLKEIQYQTQQGVARTLKRVGINLLWPLTPPILRKLFTRGSAQQHIPEWLAKNFIDTIQLVQRIHSRDPRLSLSNLSSVASKIFFLGGGVQFFLEAIDRQRARYHIENRYPFFDQRIVEFAMSVPDYEKQREGKIKYLLRNRSNQFLPMLVKERRSKAEFSYLFNQAFQQSLFLLDKEKLSLGKMNWIDENLFHSAISRKKELVTKNNYASGQKTWELWFAFSINLWYNELFLKDQIMEERR